MYIINTLFKSLKSPTAQCNIENVTQVSTIASSSRIYYSFISQIVEIIHTNIYFFCCLPLHMRQSLRMCLVSFSFYFPVMIIINRYIVKKLQCPTLRNKMKCGTNKMKVSFPSFVHNFFFFSSMSCFSLCCALCFYTRTNKK